MKLIVLLAIQLVLINNVKKTGLHSHLFLKDDEEGASGDFSYENGGQEWPGKCQSGKHQSPVNIIDGVNTFVNKFDSLVFDYVLKPDFAGKSQKFIFTGKTLEMDADIGQISYFHKDGTKEDYRATKIVLHYPAEHLITLNGQTPRRDLEMQIEHQLLKTTSQDTTNKVIKVKRMIVSILFRDNSILPGGDKFFESLGVTEAGLGVEGFRKLKVDEELKHLDAGPQRGQEEHGFGIESLLGLRNIINYDHHIYQYYGSYTQPPCEENVSWVVFALPRSISEGQMNIIKVQLENKRKDAKGDENINTEASQYYGNNRAATVYQDNPKNGKINSMTFGIQKIQGLSFPKTPL